MLPLVFLSIFHYTSGHHPQNRSKLKTPNKQTKPETFSSFVPSSVYPTSNISLCMHRLDFPDLGILFPIAYQVRESNLYALILWSSCSHFVQTQDVTLVYVFRKPGVFYQT